MIQIDKLNLDDITVNSHNIVYGLRGSGNTTLIKNIIYHFYTKNIDNIDNIVVFSATDEIYNKFLPQKNIYHEINCEIIGNILEKQKNEKENMILILDDCLNSFDKWTSNPSINELLFNGRFYNITFFALFQFPIGIKPEIRCNFDNIFIFSDGNVSNQKRFFEHYCNFFPSFDIFQQNFEEITKNYNSLVVSQKGKKNTIQDRIKYYKSNMDLEFKIDKIYKIETESETKTDFSSNSKSWLNTENNFEVLHNENKNNIITILHNIAESNNSIVKLLDKLYYLE
jgi:hypothetical protein